MTPGGPPDIVPDVDEPELRKIYGSDAPTVIAFRRFLHCPENEEGKTVVSPAMHRWCLGEISAEELLELEPEPTA